MKLWVIGNGFDLALGLHTGYNNFRSFLRHEDPRKYEDLAKLFSDNGDWSDFEEKLADPSEQFLNIIDSIEENFGRENSLFDKVWWSSINECLQKWLRLAETPFTSIDAELAKVILLMKKDDYFINFNLTYSIERLLESPQENIMHPHGTVLSENQSVANLDPSVTFGHKPVPNEILSKMSEKCRRFIEITKKPTEKARDMIKTFLLAHSKPETIYVYGFGWGEVDWPYLDEILGCSFEEDSFYDSRIPWIIYCHSLKDVLKAQKYFRHIGFRNSKPAIVFGNEQLNLLEFE